jgi:hypothetical protein
MDSNLPTWLADRIKYYETEEEKIAYVNNFRNNEKISRLIRKLKKLDNDLIKPKLKDNTEQTRINKINEIKEEIKKTKEELVEAEKTRGAWDETHGSKKKREFRKTRLDENNETRESEKKRAFGETRLAENNENQDSEPTQEDWDNFARDLKDDTRRRSKGWVELKHLKEAALKTKDPVRRHELIRRISALQGSTRNDIDLDALGNIDYNKNPNGIGIDVGVNDFNIDQNIFDDFDYNLDPTIFGDYHDNDVNVDPNGVGINDVFDDNLNPNGASLNDDEIPNLFANSDGNYGNDDEDLPNLGNENMKEFGDIDDFNDPDQLGGKYHRKTKKNKKKYMKQRQRQRKTKKTYIRAISRKKYKQKKRKTHKIK